VKVTDDGTDTVVVASTGLQLSWAGGSNLLNAAGASQWRLRPLGTGFTVDYLASGKWSSGPFATTTATAVDFSSGAASIRLFRNDGTSTAYRGKVGAVRTGASQCTINRVLLDDYVRGVVPREMPSSWEASALQAQAIAARSYARYAVEHNASSAYDICDTTSCQVYGGMARYDSSGKVVYGEESGSNTAVTATAGLVARYLSATIFAQFSASNGGCCTAGSQPYLVAKADPYEVYSGDPHLNWQRLVPVADIAPHYGLTSVQSIQINQRDGHGEWGGRVPRATVVGKSGSTTKSVSTSSTTLAAEMGLPHHWFASAGSPFGHMDSVTTAPGTVTSAGWAIDPNTGGPIMVQMYIDRSANAMM
jgi:stage II sporulation protein D